MRTLNALVLIGFVGARRANAVDFEMPPEEPAAASLSAELASGADFHVGEPVQSDGLMHHYVLVGRFGDFAAYGRTALAIRVREVSALNRGSGIEGQRASPRAPLSIGRVSGHNNQLGLAQRFCSRKTK